MPLSGGDFASDDAEVNTMATGPNSAKEEARPSDAASKQEQAKIDKIAMEMAEKANKEIEANEEVNPEDTEFKNI